MSPSGGGGRRQGPYKTMRDKDAGGALSACGCVLVAVHAYRVYLSKVYRQGEDGTYLEKMTMHMCVGIRIVHLLPARPKHIPKRQPRILGGSLWLSMP